MILAGISLRSALLNLWVLIEPHVESDFPSAALRDIFSQIVALLLKYTETSQRVNFSDLEVAVFFLVTFNTGVIHIHRQTSDHTKPQLVAGDAASPLFLPVLQEKEG